MSRTRPRAARAIQDRRSAKSDDDTSFRGAARAERNKAMAAKPLSQPMAEGARSV